VVAELANAKPSSTSPTPWGQSWPVPRLGSQGGQNSWSLVGLSPSPVPVLFVSERFEGLRHFPVVAGVALGPALFVVGHLSEELVAVANGGDPFGYGNRFGQVGLTPAC